jgi:hypothetical protein
MLEAALHRTSRSMRTSAIPITERDSFPKQWAEVTSKSRFKTKKCSRRAGKTGGSVVETALDCTTKPGWRTLYINLTALNAQLQFFDPLQEFLRKKQIHFTANNSDLLIYFDNGSFVRAMGCDNIGEVKTKLGDKWDRIYVDEMQSYGDVVLKELIERAIMPTLVDRGGSLTCQGTPAVTKAGYWYDLYTKSPFAHYGWTLFDNPFIQHDIQPILDARGLKLTDPIVRREYFGEDVIDPSAIVFKYESPRNDLPTCPAYDRWGIPAFLGDAYFYETMRPEPNHPAWRFAMGLDLGFSDHDAIVVLGWRMDDPHHRLYECWSWQENHLDYLKVADVFKRAVEKWMPQKICVDTGGHGARKIMESLKAVFSMFTFTMKPASVLDSISLVNDELRSGRMLIDPNGILAHDLGLVVWTDGKHEVEMSDAFHSDLAAALRYAHSCAYHYQSEGPPPVETDDDRRIRQWLEARAVREDPSNPYRGGNSSYD